MATAGEWRSVRCEVQCPSLGGPDRLAVLMRAGEWVCVTECATRSAFNFQCCTAHCVTMAGRRAISAGEAAMQCHSVSCAGREVARQVDDTRTHTPLRVERENVCAAAPHTLRVSTLVDSGAQSSTHTRY